jgi:hypothetical protein
MTRFMLVLCVLCTVACDEESQTDADADTDTDVDGDGDTDADGDTTECPEDAQCCDDSDCSDQVYCNGLEICDRGRCEMDPEAYCTPSGVCSIACDDGLECTEDSCNELANICEHSPQHEVCDDDDRCDGTERCDPGDDDADERGCIEGIPMVCDDGDDCTQDYCEANECHVRLRDGDGDGHGDRDCEICTSEDDCVRGDDCDDGEASVFPGAVEVCADGLDNNCDHDRDYEDPSCVVPNDSCSSALELPGGTTVFSSTRGTTADIPESCGPASYLDTAFYFALPSARDVEVEIFAVTGHDVYVTLTPDCLSGETNIACERGRRFTFSRRALPAGTYYVVVAADGEIDFSITLSTSPTGETPPGDLCDSAERVRTDGTPTRVSFDGTEHDYSLSCAADPLRDVVYELVVPTEYTADFSVEADSGMVAVALQDTCGLASSERGCWSGDGAASGRIWRLIPGTYSIIVGHAEEVEVDLAVTLAPIDPGLYYFEEFNGEPAGWTLSGAWEQGVPTGAGGTPSPDAGGCIATVIGGTYPANMTFANDYAQTPSIDLRGARAPVLRFRSWLRTAAWGDGMHVEVSTDGGARWTVINPPGMTPPYDGTVGGARVWWGEHGTWSDFSVPLSAYVGQVVSLRFAAFSDWWDHYPGWYVDSVMVIDP